MPRRPRGEGDAGHDDDAPVPDAVVLRTVDVSDNGFGLAGATAFARCLSSHLDVFVSLVLDRNDVGSRGATLLAAACANPLNHHTFALVYLGLNNANIGKHGAQALLVGLVDQSVTVDIGLDDNPEVSSAIKHEINLQQALIKSNGRFSLTAKFAPAAAKFKKFSGTSDAGTTPRAVTWATRSGQDAGPTPQPPRTPSNSGPAPSASLPSPD